MTDLSCEDQLAIHDLIARYSHFIDAGDATAWSKLFTQNAELKTPVGNAKGKEAIYLWAKSRIDKRDPNIQSRHFVTNIILTKIDETTVSARSMLLLTAQNKEQENSAKLLATSIYLDTFSKLSSSDGNTRWLFSKRETDIHLPLDAANLPFN